MYFSGSSDKNNVAIEKWLNNVESDEELDVADVLRVVDEQIEITPLKHLRTHF